MKMRLIEDVSDELDSIEELPKDVHLYVTKDFKYYFYDGKSLHKVPLKMVSQMIQQQETAEREDSKESDAKFKARIQSIRGDIDSGKLKSDIEYEMSGKNIGDMDGKEPDMSGKKDLTPLEQLQKDIYDFVASEVGMVHGKGYRRPSRYETDPSISLRVRTRTHQKKRPKINVYFDRSGSWNDDKKTQLGWQAIKSLYEFKRKGLIDLVVYYFAVHVYSGEDGEAHALMEGNNSTDPIIQHMIKTQPDNVVIMTDSHMSESGCDDWGWWPIKEEDATKWYSTHELWKKPDSSIPTNVECTKLVSKYVAPGAVWAIFYGGEAKNLVPNHLKGAVETKTYKF